MSLPRVIFGRVQTRPVSTFSTKLPSEKVVALKPSSTSESLVEGNDKEVRAYEHDRQRSKKASDLVRTKARKAQQQQQAVAGLISKLHDSKKSSSAPDKASLKPSNLGPDAELFEPPLVPVIRRPLPEARPPPERLEVKLVDLITTRKPRNLKGPDDFEIIPHIRSVIALDDVDSSDSDSLLDEPWEHVSDETDKPAYNGPSYASIVAHAN